MTMIRPTLRARLLSLFIAASVLSACGGGGVGGEAAPPAPAPAPSPAPAPAPAPAPQADPRIQWSGSSVFFADGIEQATPWSDGAGGLVLLVPCRTGTQGGTALPARLVRYSAQQGLHDERVLDACPTATVETRDGLAVITSASRRLFTSTGWRALPDAPPAPRFLVPSSGFELSYGPPSHLEAWSAGPQGELVLTRVWNDPWITTTVVVHAFRSDQWQLARQFDIPPRVPDTTPARTIPSTGVYTRLRATLGARDFFAELDIATEEIGFFIGRDTFIYEDQANPGTWRADRSAGVSCGRNSLNGFMNCAFFVAPDGELRYHTTNFAPSLLFTAAGAWALRAPAQGSVRQWVPIVSANRGEILVLPGSVTSAQGNAFARDRDGNLLEGGERSVFGSTAATSQPVAGERYYLMDPRGEVVVGWNRDSSTLTSTLSSAVRKGVRSYTELRLIETAGLTWADQPMRLLKTGDTWSLVVSRRLTQVNGTVRTYGLQVFTGTPVQ